ncbi:hypothetical protein LMF32_00170 [Desemzia sp. C1]|uniref:conjugal transfer protein TrbL family protein n=1 Tax=Desemzia sp. C1 TaxID=2892016 RepID=UPI001E45D4CE|nr:conjugal transfer protein TrbL family protein [Desemzia sp. C1]MCI3027551.1 hypothetical protein [Desemzia sp. C1]
MPSFDNLGTKILEMIRDWLIELVEIFISFLQNILFNYEGLGGIALQAYDLFVWFGGLLLVSVALGKVINQLVGEAEGSQEANIWHTVVGSFKAGILLVLMPFTVSVVMNGIIEPFTDYFVGLMGDEMIVSIESLVESENFVDVFGGVMGQLLIWLFVMIVVAFFIFKIFIEQAQLLMDEILSPLVAISVVSESFSFIDNWWRDIISHTVTIIVLTLSMALFVEALTMEADTIWTKLPALIGTGALVITGPSLVRSIWFSSGVGRTGQSVARSAMHLVARR